MRSMAVMNREGGTTFRRISSNVSKLPFGSSPWPMRHGWALRSSVFMVPVRFKVTSESDLPMSWMYSSNSSTDASAASGEENASVAVWPAFSARRAKRMASISGMTLVRANSPMTLADTRVSCSSSSITSMWNSRPRSNSSLRVSQSRLTPPETKPLSRS